ncbi:MAG: deoxyribonuclease IV [Phycisphaerae bacterium]|nr:deoxyribonuclease IV [Phycisphaerae bacterium]
MSIAGGVHHALVAAESVGCDCVQIFVKNQRQWSAPPIDPEELTRWRRARRRTAVSPVVAHATYLINLASPDKTMWRRSVDAFTEEIHRCAALRIRDVIIHPGSHKGAGLGAGVGQIVRALDEICQATADSGVRILLETTAGSGHGVGSRFEHLAEIIAGARQPRRLGVCLDTCHLFAAGYELRTPEGYERTLSELRRHIGLRRVRCIHVNDSKKGLGANVDRHEHIGMGKLGLRAFRLLVNDDRLARVPKILETPKGQDPRGRDFDKVNLAKLRRLINRR